MPNIQIARTMSDTTTPSVDRLDERINQLMSAVGEIKDRLDQVPTRAEMAALVSKAEHSAAVVALEGRISTLEGKVAEASGRSRLGLIKELALTIAAVGAAGLLVVNLVHLFDKVAK